jgi:hypothetical protein
VQNYLSVCAIYRDEADYLREWVEFHLLVGAERFFLYDNLSEDNHREVLGSYLEDGTVILKQWPFFPGQRSAYDDCLKEHRDDSRWIAFLDLDEFLFSPTGRPVSELLVDYERWPGLGVNWAVFGSSGHRRRPPGLVIENYVWRRPTVAPRHCQIKSIVDPKRTMRSLSPHHFHYNDGFAVDENQNPIDKPPRSKTAEVSFSRLRVNHYWIKSEVEWRRKLANPEAWTGTMRQSYEAPAKMDQSAVHEAFNEEHDDAIKLYVPALREVLGLGPAAKGQRGRSEQAQLD